MGLLGAMAGLGKGLSMVAEDNMKTIQRQEETAASEERQMRIAAWQAKMNEEYALAKEERAVARDDAKTKRLIDDTMKADTRSGEIGTDRRFAKFKQDGLAAGYFEGMSDDEIKQAFKDHYDDRQVTTEAGGDRYQDKTREIKSQDRLKAAQETGNSGLIATSLKGVDDARAADAIDAKERQARAESARKERRDEQRWEYEQETLRIRDKQADTQARRVEGALAKVGAKASDPLSERKAIVSEIKELESTMPKPPDTSKLVGKMKEKADADYAAKLEAWKRSEDGQILAALRQRQRELMSNKPSESKPAGGQSVIKSLPEGARQIGTSGGKPVYQTPDGKKFIAQ